MRKILLLAVILLINAMTAKSQTISGATKSCPNAAFNYGLTGYDNTKLYRWKITKGKRTSDNATEFCGLSANIRWDPDLALNGKIEVYTVTACNQPTPGTLVASLNIRAFNFTAASTMPTTNGTCAATPAYPALTCGSSQDIDVWFMLPLHNNSDYNDVSSYDFTANSDQVALPTGWSVIASSFVTSDYTCTELAGQKYKRVMVRVRTDGIHDGQVKVRVSGNCSSGTSAFHGAWSYPKSFSFAAPNFMISGPSSFCTSGTYTIPDLPTGATVSWSVGTSSIVSISSAVGNSATLTKLDDGLFTLTATVTTTCSTSRSKSLPLVAGPPPITIVGPYDPTFHTIMGVACKNKEYYFIASDSEYGQAYTWTLFPPSGSDEFPVMYSGSQINLFFSETGNYTLRVTKTNECSTTSTDMIINVQDCYFGFKLAASPNPAVNLITVTLDEETKRSKVNNSPKLVKFELIHINTARKLKQWAFKDNQDSYTLNVAGLSPGTYILNAEKGNHKQSLRLMIK